MATAPQFSITASPDSVSSDTLLIGLADLGVAGLTAVDYFIDQTSTMQIGHIERRGFPAITPFAMGKPRHPMRIYETSTASISVFISEVFLPVWAAEEIVEAILDWAIDASISEIVVLIGVPFRHSEDDHGVYYVADQAFQSRRLAATSIEPLSGGVFDGVVGELIERSMDRADLATGILVTPAHYPGPDFDGSLALLDGLQTIYDVSVDKRELQARSDEMKQYYQTLANRMETLREGDQSLMSRDYPEDRMYM